MLSILRKSTVKTTTTSTVASEELSTWEIVDPTLTDDDEDIYSINEHDVTLQESSATKDEEVEKKGARESGLVDDVTRLVNDQEKVERKELLDDFTRLVKDEEKTKMEMKGACESGLVDDVTRLVSEEEDDVDEDDDGVEEDLMPWKLKGRFEKQKMGKRGGSMRSLNKMPCYYHTRPKTVLERRGKRLVW